jgi:hypothetical protein
VIRLPRPHLLNIAIAYCYHLVNVIIFSQSQSDYIKPLPLYNLLVFVQLMLSSPDIEQNIETFFSSVPGFLTVKSLFDQTKCYYYCLIFTLIVDKSMVPHFQKE